MTEKADYSSSSPAIILTTFPISEPADSSNTATSVVHGLLEAKLIACANIIPQVRSLYSWNGKIEDSKEQLVIIKTTQEQIPELKKALLSNHPYDTPEFIAINPSDISDDYNNWLVKSVCKEEPNDL